jgi:branched-chain amino acid transport system ATP-binding protein
MLKVEQLQAFYGTSQALFDMNLQVDKGEVVTLIGRNGMGKTTTIHSIMGIVSAASGAITYQGKNITALSPFKIARLGLALVPEGRQIFPNLTVNENLIATAANKRGNTNPWTKEKILDLFPPLAERLSSMGNLLSGGEQQMLAIGRALMTNPDLLLLDDATEGLAPLVRKDIWSSLNALKNAGLSILIVDKNLNDLAAIADRHYVIEKGNVVWLGNSQQLTDDPTIKDKYLGV